jgi:futalosine hydrolase
LGSAGTLLKTELCDVLISGVGQLQSAVHITARLAASPGYDVVIQAGLAGSFSDRFGKCSVVSVHEEVLADFGAESDSGFLDISDMGLLAPDQPPFVDALLKNPHQELLARIELPCVRSATVNRTLSDPRSIGWVEGRYKPEVVNMEGAALFHACLTCGVPFLEIRAISDRVGPRNKSTWDIPGAVAALNISLREVLPRFLRSAELPVP